MNHTEVELSSIVLERRVKVTNNGIPHGFLYPIRYDDKAFLIECVLDDVQIKEAKLCKSRLKPDCDPQIKESWEEVCMPTQKRLAVFRIHAEMEEFWCRLYERIATLVEEMDRAQGIQKEWKQVNGHPVYEGLNHILTWDNKGCVLLVLTKLLQAKADAILLIQEVYIGPLTRRIRIRLL